MSKKQTLLDLADRVEAGSTPNKEINKVLFPTRRVVHPYPDYCGSLDTVKVLHDAVLPGWEAIIYLRSGASIWTHDTPRFRGYCDSSAAAWVAAILRAKAQEQNDE